VKTRETLMSTLFHDFVRKYLIRSRWTFFTPSKFYTRSLWVRC